MGTFTTPGVYLKEVDIAPPRALRLGITGFVGQAERGPLNTPQPLTNWGQFLDIFGTFVGFSYLPYAVFGFFLNGGERCHVVRVAHESATRATLDIVDQTNRPAIRVRATSEGQWANGLGVTLQEQSTDDLTLTTLDADLAAGEDRARFKSVAGLAGEDLVGTARRDTVTLIHPTDPFVREDKLPIRAIDFQTREVIFSRPVTTPFPAGSSILAKGFKLLFRLQRSGVLVRDEVFDNLSMEETHPRYFVRVINGEPEEKEFVTRLRNGSSIVARVEPLSNSMLLPLSRPQRVEAQELANGEDGFLKLDSRYYTGRVDESYFRPVPPGADAVQLREAGQQLFGLAAFEAVNEVGAIAIPDLIIPDFYDAPGVETADTDIVFRTLPFDTLSFNELKTGQHEMLRHCERTGDRFAILDAPRGARIGKSASRIEDWSSAFQLFSNARNGALYYPWIRERVVDFDGRDLFIPPSGHIAGIYARSEKERGVGKAPANEALRGIVQLEFSLTDPEQDVLNPRGVNCLRMLPGRGLKVWGARTLSLDPLWRYVNVRRLCLAVIKYLLANLQWSVFEPNDQRLRDKIASTLTRFLRELFQTGALAGARPEEAFFVKCDQETNPLEVVEQGQVVTEIGFAPARPAEFILVTVTRTAESLSVREQPVT